MDEAFEAGHGGCAQGWRNGSEVYGMAKGKIVSIGLRLTLTSIGIIALLVALVGYLNYSEVRRAYEDSAEREQQRRLVALREASLITGKRMARSVAIALAGNDYAALQDLVTSAQRVDPLCRYGRILDPEGAVMADTDEAVQQQILKGEYRKKYSLPAEVSIRIQCPPDTPSCSEGNLTPATVLADNTDQLVFEVGVPVTDEEQGIRYGHIVFGYTLRALRADLQATGERMRDKTRSSLKRSVAFGALAGLLGLLVAVLQGLSMTRPLKKLASAAAGVAAGDFTIRAAVEHNDEIGQLAQTFNEMTERLVVLMDERARQATLQKEMEVARTIQETLIPPQELVDRGSIRFIGAFTSASICGGDWWSYSDLNDGKVLVAIGDVTGHGVPSAMITAAAKSSLDTLRHTTRANLSVTYLLEEMNKTIYAAAQRKFVMTFFASVFDTRTRTITFSNAGHNFPYLVHPGADGRPARIGVLMTRGNRLGDVWDSKFVERTATLSPGDLVVWYTDGLVEGTNPEGKMFGDRRLRRVLVELCEREPEEVLEGVLEAFGQHQAEAPLEDDIMLVVGKVY